MNTNQYNDEVLGVFSHVSIGTNYYDRAVKFYETVLSSLGIRILMQHPGATAFGKAYPEFWVQSPINGQPATIGNGSHFAFLASNREAVDRFHKTAIEYGAQNDGDPGPRPDYGHRYYGAFIRDLDGHKIEVMHWEMESDGA